MPSPHVSLLRQHVRTRLINRPRTVTFEHIAQATGLTRAWLEKLVADASPDCSVAKCEILYTYFEGRELKL